jgi:hypothetical protein
VASDPAAIRPATLVDSCVLLDVITGDEQWADWSAREIAAAMDVGRVVVNPLIYAEVSVGYQTIEELTSCSRPPTTSVSRCPTWRASPPGRHSSGTGAAAATNDRRCRTSTSAHTLQ